MFSVAEVWSSEVDILVDFINKLSVPVRPYPCSSITSSLHRAIPRRWHYSMLHYMPHSTEHPSWERNLT